MRIRDIFFTEDRSEFAKKSLLYNVNWFISLRWVAALTIFLMTFAATNIFGVRLNYIPIYIVGFVVILYNMLLFIWFKLSQLNCKGDSCVRYAMISAHLQIILDITALTFLIHLSGGIESPFLFVFIFHPIFASIIISDVSAYLYSVFSIAAVIIMTLLERGGVLSHYHISEIFVSENISSSLYIVSSITSFVLIQVVSVIITSLIMRDFRKKQADLERIRAELEEKNKKLKQKDEMRLLFLASATHDLKSPLNTITSYIQSMVDGYMGNITDEQRRVLQRILNRINGLRQLISDILILGEFESGEEKEVKSERFDIIQLLRESVEEFRPLASERGISLRFESYVERAYVKADPLKIDEVIHNYISNAIKYNRDNGSVMVRAELKGGFVEVSVADTGIGLKEEDLKRLFTDFFRASEVKKNKIEGTGLGLAIVKRIIERYGGYVWAESRYNEGSTFYFKLPVDSSEEGGAGAPAG